MVAAGTSLLLPLCLAGASAHGVGGSRGGAGRGGAGALDLVSLRPDPVAMVMDLRWRRLKLLVLALGGAPGLAAGGRWSWRGEGLLHRLDGPPGARAARCRVRGVNRQRRWRVPWPVAAVDDDLVVRRCYARGGVWFGSTHSRLEGVAADAAVRLLAQPSHRRPSEGASVGWWDNGDGGVVGLGPAFLARRPC